jgi:repressor LexA
VTFQMPKPRLFEKDHVLQAINAWVIQHGQPPTVVELKSALGVGSIRTVLRYLDWLEESGDIERRSGARGIRLRRGVGGLETVAVPVLGVVPAGSLMTAEQNIEGWLRVPKTTIHPASAKFFFLRVRGDSMNKAKIGDQAIESGDLVLIRQQSTAEPRDIVVALIDGEATIKRFLRGDGYLYLKPDSTNPEHQPIVLEPGFQIQGVAVQLFKKGAALMDETGE